MAVSAYAETILVQIPKGPAQPAEPSKIVSIIVHREKFYRCKTAQGRVSEWLQEPVLKAGMLAKVSGI